MVKKTTSAERGIEREKVNANDGSSNEGDEDSCSTRAGIAFAFDFGILRVGSGWKEGENWAEFVMWQLFRWTVEVVFRNVFDAEVQKLEAYGFQLGTEIATTGDNSWPMPVNLKSLIRNAQKTFKIVEAVDKLQKRLKVVIGDDAMSMEAQKNATLFFSILLHSTFASKRVLNEYRLTREPFDWVIVR
ncbi:hypothetical protein RJ639_043698 [Escallonia herrerae]|uniref:RNA polymerase Rpb1 domain-containing protein n=1 Tax=Escallonia herrerae TaxID=1293975 RepID=A0AA88WLE0_9ASTE|nr:hypothetical protein RJ639_043698 [Escallonia herrerae]